jgi:hypothetical protein
MKLNNRRARRVERVMRPLVVALALVIGSVQALPAADCHCRPGCDGSAARSPSEPRSCCGDEIPAQPEPCACFHRAAPDPSTAMLNAPPANAPVAAEAPVIDFDAHVLREVLPLSNAWRAVQARGSPLHLLYSVLLI